MTFVDKVARLSVLVATVGTVACATAPEPFDYTAFRAESPRSIVVLPALNNTTDVEAHEWFVSTVSRPFAERGYYTYPAWMVKETLARSGLEDMSLVYSADPRRLDQIFECDAAMYIDIKKWESKYVVIQTNTTVAFDYALRSCDTGQTLWSNSAELTYSPSANANTGNFLANMVAQAVVSAIEKGRPNYIPLAQQANAVAASVEGRGLPAGPYLPEQFGQDTDVFPSGASAPTEATNQ